MIIIKKGDTMNKLECKKCGHKWVQRTENKPQECPKCKNRKWDD